MKQDYAINADYNIGNLSTNHTLLLNGKPIGTNYTAGDGINISEDNVISVDQSIIPQGIPAGCVMSYFGYTTPTGWHDCDGRELLKAQYPALYAAIGDTFGAASSSDKFKLPNLYDRFIRHTTNTNQLFTTQEPGVPDISGYVSGVQFAGGQQTTAGGVFNAAHQSTELGWDGGTIPTGTIDFYASRSNGIYKPGLDDVRVKAMYAHAIIKD